MSDPRYQKGIGQGMALSSGGMFRCMRWPDYIPGLGGRRGGHPFGRCKFCSPSVHIAIAGTFARYGDTPVCERHAVETAKKAAA